MPPSGAPSTDVLSVGKHAGGDAHGMRAAGVRMPVDVPTLEGSMVEGLTVERGHEGAEELRGARGVGIEAKGDAACGVV